LDNQELHELLDAINSSIILILGRFTKERKNVLDAIRVELRKAGFVPVIFDFDVPNTRSYRETVSALGHISRMIIADVTDAKVILQELESLVPRLSSVPIAPIAEKGLPTNVVIDRDYKNFKSFMPLLEYQDLDDIIRRL